MEEAMVLYRARFVQQLLGPVHEASAESCPGTIGHITLDAKQTGTRSAGNPHAACDEAGIGNGFTVRILRHSQRKQGAPARLDLRSTAPVLDPTFRGGHGNNGIIRSPFSAMALLDNFRGDGGNGGIIRSPLSVSILLDHLREWPPFVFFHTSRKNVTCMSAVPPGLRMDFWFRQPHAEARG